MTDHHPALKLCHVSTVGAGGIESGYVIENVSLACEAGTWTALAGPDAAGMAGVLRCAAGLDQVTAGEVRLAEGLRLAHLGLQPVPEHPETLASALAGRPAELLHEALHRLGLWEERDTPVADLTGARQRTAALVLALADSPDVLLADDLTGGLPTDTATAVLDLLRDLVDRQGLCVLASGTGLAALEQADVVVLLTEGRVVETRVMP